MSEERAPSPRLGGVIHGLVAADHFDAIEQLSSLLGEKLTLSDAIRISAGAIARESLVSTHIGLGAAIPHARLPALDHFLIAVGLCTKPVQWGESKAEVRVVVLSAVPYNANMPYLAFVKGLIQALKSEDQRAELMMAADEASLRHWLGRHLNLHESA